MKQTEKHSKSLMDMEIEGNCMARPKVDEALVDAALIAAAEPRENDAELVRETPQPTILEVMGRLPDLNKNQRRIAFLIAKGHTAMDIARITGVTASYVGYLMKDDRIKEMIRMVQGGYLEEMAEELSPSQVLERAAARAAEVLAEKIDSGLNEDAQIRAALAVLDRSGYGQKREAPITQVIIGVDELAAIEKARREAGLTKPQDGVTFTNPLTGDKDVRA